MMYVLIVREHLRLAKREKKKRMCKIKYIYKCDSKLFIESRIAIPYEIVLNEERVEDTYMNK